MRELAEPASVAAAEAEAAAAALDWGWGVIVNFKKTSEATKRDGKEGKKSRDIGVTADYEVWACCTACRDRRTASYHHRRTAYDRRRRTAYDRHRRTAYH